MKSLKPSDICGTWKLESFQIKAHDNQISAWGRDVHGLLIYTESGHMSVSINKSVEKDADLSEIENIFDSILFYSGTYRFEGDTICHRVTNASNPSRIGKDMVRYPELNSNTLTLTSPEDSFGQAILTWRRVC